ncbi:MAG: GcrA cell cycle regulator [Hyphomicrobiales bacterium]|nr:GcrA cell cycle regulator [Hyphomicrobiales bacterium]
MSDVSTWTEDRVELLKKLWNDGLSASQIAGELGGVTRNAVIGKVHRLGLSGRAKTQSVSASAVRPRKPAASRTSPAFNAAAHVRGSAALAPQIRAQPEPRAEPRMELLDPDVVVPFSERVTIMELKENMCRWPMGDPTHADFRFCGLKTDSGVPYCGYHCRIAYQPAGDRRREQERRAQQQASRA